MRPIDNAQLIRAANLDQLNAENVAVGTDAEISWEDFLRDYPEEARNLRTGLWAIGLMKCWFSEALLQQGEGHIEHYRPKRRLAGDRHDGYRWRTFDWHNLRLAHSTVNFRRRDYLAKRQMGKGSYFPLRDPRRRANNSAEEINEEPVLLDPIVATDTFLITFDAASGAPRPRFRKEENEWLHRRAADSIDYYHLNEGTWNYKRADRMAEVQKLCEQLEEIAIRQPRDQDAYESKINEIVRYINSFAEFSSACLQVVRERGLLEHFALGL
jgi:hypothetical protein